MSDKDWDMFLGGPPGPHPGAVAMGIAIVIAIAIVLYGVIAAHAFGPIPKRDQCISVNAMIQRNCAPVYMCNGTPDTNASWCCSARWVDEETKLVRWYKRHCEK